LGVLRIVQVAPDYITVPPAKYGGIERVVFDLTEELVRLGHDVFLYALPGSRTSATLIPYRHSQDAWQLARFVQDTLPWATDVVHDHTHGSVVGQTLPAPPCVCSIHVPWCSAIKHPVFLSNYMLNKLGSYRGFMVHNGIQLDEYEFTQHKSDYLLFMGRLIKSKGILQAIEVAERTAQRLVIAGPSADIVEPESYSFYIHEVQPRIERNPNIEYVGEVGGTDRIRILKHAKCVLFPSDEEAFGLVMIEAMACGSPVMAFRKGTVPEVLSAFPELICDSLEDMVHKVNSACFPPPSLLRKQVSDHFSSALMAERYLEVYREVLQYPL
jgi:glycosyltransferase involved in cell wall biosynthesis